MPTRLFFRPRRLIIKEVTHFNVHDPEYWAEQFAQHSFYRDMEADLSYITSWAVRFVKTTRTNSRLVQEYERKFWQLRKENFDLRQLSAEMQGILRQLEHQSQGLGIQLTEKEQNAQALTAQLMEMRTSKAWKFSTEMRKVRFWLFPEGSTREHVAKQIWHGVKKFGRGTSNDG